MKLELLFDRLLTRAMARRQDQAAELSGGARLAVRVRDGVTTITISRLHKRVGDTELVTFRRVCRVPATAERIPAEGQGLREGRHYIAFRWREAPAQEGLEL